MMRLFVDTAGWMAMADKSDPCHGQSLAVRDDWLKSEGILCTTNYIVDETLTLIRMRLGLKAARQWWAIISQSPRCKIEWITPEREAKALEWFFRWQDQSFSFTDCTSFVVMEELAIQNVLTVDRHFITAGFIAVPKIGDSH